MTFKMIKRLTRYDKRLLDARISLEALGFNPCDDNEADALALLKLVREKY